MGEIVIGIVLIVFCAIIFWKSGSFPEGNEAQLGAGSFPVLIASLLSLLALLLVILKAKELFQQKAERSKVDVKEYLKGFYAEYKLVILTLLIFVIYIFLMQFIGFIVTTILFIIATGLLIGSRKKKDIMTVSIVAVAVTLTTYYFFENVLYVRFPTGIFF